MDFHTRLRGFLDSPVAQRDIAKCNLVCATGLPGSERIDELHCLKTLDKWSEKVRHWTTAAYREFYLPNPEAFGGTVARFQVIALLTALARHCGVKYNSTKIGLGPRDPFDFDEQFIHGVIQGVGGTCATLPVVYTAVGRRLGYPISLAFTKQHVYCRWDDPQTGEQFSFDGSDHGYSFHTDDHYRRWPVLITPVEEQRNYYLRSLSTWQEAAMFTVTRGLMLKDNQRFLEAIDAFVVATLMHDECL